MIRTATNIYNIIEKNCWFCNKKCSGFVSICKDCEYEKILKNIKKNKKHSNEKEFEVKFYNTKSIFLKSDQEFVDFDDEDNSDLIECDLNCIVVGWALQKLANDDTQPLKRRCDARIIRSWILSNSFGLDDIPVASVWAAFNVLHALRAYKPCVENESIDFVSRYENVLSYFSNIFAICFDILEDEMHNK